MMPWLTASSNFDVVFGGGIKILHLINEEHFVDQNNNKNNKQTTTNNNKDSRNKIILCSYPYFNDTRHSINESVLIQAFFVFVFFLVGSTDLALLYIKSSIMLFVFVSHECTES